MMRKRNIVTKNNEGQDIIDLSDAKLNKTLTNHDLNEVTRIILASETLTKLNLSQRQHLKQCGSPLEIDDGKPHGSPHKIDSRQQIQTLVDAIVRNPSLMHIDLQGIPLSREDHDKLIELKRARRGLELNVYDTTSVSEEEKRRRTVRSELEVEERHQPRLIR
ncbi:MAG TPA: hypothetical protein VNC84_07725 [Gammaproteobacteria bacterium]|nr:hypothetical protein [Gammaproteobacteria bacterium]